MFSVFGAYMPTVLLILVAVFTIYMAATVILTFVCDPHRGISYLASQWPRYLILGVLCGVMLFTYGYIDHRNVQQFRDEGQTLRAQYAAQEKTNDRSMEATSLVVTINEYNKHLDTLNKAFHFPQTRAVMNTISKI